MIIYTYNSGLLINKSGVKKTTKNVDGSEVTIFSLEKLSEGNRVVGYTDLKPYSSERFNILSVKRNDDKSYSNIDFNVFKKKHRLFHKTEGYIPVGTDGNEFIEVVKIRFLPIILLILLLLGMLLCFNYCNSNIDGKKPWRPTIQDFSNQWQDEDTTKLQNSIDVVGFTAIAVDSKTGNAKVSLINPEGNPCYFKFYIYTENGVPLYESDLVPPNKEITKITLNTKLEEGSHKGYVFIETFELETGNEMNSAKFDIDIISR